MVHCLQDSTSQPSASSVLLASAAREQPLHLSAACARSPSRSAPGRIPFCGPAPRACRKAAAASSAGRRRNFLSRNNFCRIIVSAGGFPASSQLLLPALGIEYAGYRSLPCSTGRIWPGGEALFLAAGSREEAERNEFPTVRFWLSGNQFLSSAWKDGSRSWETPAGCRLSGSVQKAKQPDRSGWHRSFSWRRTRF
jgi:hypothetical protein